MSSYNRQITEKRPAANEKQITVYSKRLGGRPISKTVFPSPNHGYIRDAVTNNVYNVRIGSKGEEMFYKVAVCNGSLKDNNTLFFHSPEECESLFEIVLDPVQKQNWCLRSTKNKCENTVK